MHTLSVRQPYAWAIIHGGKSIENRTWRTSYRGRLAIHAARSRADLGAVPGAPDAEALAFGQVIGTVELVDCVPLARVDGLRWARGPVCWLLAHAEPIEPFAWSGALGLFHVPDHLIRPTARTLIKPALVLPG